MRLWAWGLIGALMALEVSGALKRLPTALIRRAKRQAETGVDDDGYEWATETYETTGDATYQSVLGTGQSVGYFYGGAWQYGAGGAKFKWKKGANGAKWKVGLGGVKWSAGGTGGQWQTGGTGGQWQTGGGTWTGGGKQKLGKTVSTVKTVTQKKIPGKKIQKVKKVKRKRKTTPAPTTTTTTTTTTPKPTPAPAGPQGFRGFVYMPVERQVVEEVPVMEEIPVATTVVASAPLPPMAWGWGGGYGAGYGRGYQAGLRQAAMPMRQSSSTGWRISPGASILPGRFEFQGGGGGQIDLGAFGGGGRQIMMGTGGSGRGMMLQGGMAGLPTMGQPSGFLIGEGGQGQWIGGSSSSSGPMMFGGGSSAGGGNRGTLVFRSSGSTSPMASMGGGGSMMSGSMMGGGGSMMGKPIFGGFGAGGGMSPLLSRRRRN